MLLTNAASLRIYHFKVKQNNTVLIVLINVKFYFQTKIFFSVRVQIHIKINCASSSHKFKEETVLLFFVLTYLIGEI